MLISEYMLVFIMGVPVFIMGEVHVSVTLLYWKINQL